MDSGSHLKLTTIVLITLGVVLSSLAIAAVSSEVVNAEDDEIILEDSNNDLETLRVINYNFSTRDIPEDKDAKLKVVLQNSGTDTSSGTVTLNSSPSGDATLDINPSSISYNIEPGSRQTFVFNIEANNENIDVRERVDLSIEVNPDSGGSVVVDDPSPDTPNYPEDGTEVDDVYPQDDKFAVYVLPKGSSVSEGTIEPTGERQAITKSFTSFKHNGPTTLGSYSNSIPPTTLSGGEYQNTSQGLILNFLSSTTSNDSEYTRIESGTDGNIKVGIASRNIPDTQYYTLQFRYQFLSSTLDQAEINIVGQDGGEIDTNTKYMLSDTGSRETRYFQLSEKETEWIQQNNSIYVVIENTDLNTDNEKLGVYFTQIISSDEPLEVTTSDLTIQDAEILNRDGSESTDLTFSTEEVYKVQYTVKNEGDKTGTRVIPLYENGTIVAEEDITLNPGETGTVTFSVNQGESQVYRYDDPSSTTSGDLKVYVEGDEPLPPIATISLPPEPNLYPNNTLATNPDDPRLMELDASDSIAPNSSIDEYIWTFEWIDGEVTTSNSTVEVQSPSTKGDYQITLTVRNEEGKEDITSATLRAGTIAPVAPSREDITLSVGDELLLDASGAEHPVGILDGRCITEYRWVLGDGTVIAQNQGTCDDPPSTTATHTFTTGGTYQVELVVEDDQGNTDSTLREVTADAPEPEAAVTVGKTERLVDRTFTFDASNSYTNEGTITEYEWKMGDGTTRQTNDPTLEYAYSSSGLYNVEVTVYNDLGGKDTATTTVSVLEQPFDIGISGPTSGDTSEEITYDNGPTENRENVQDWTWTMGDGTTYENKDVIIHQFDSAGTYEVTLTGSTDEYGGYTDSETVTVDITTAPPVPIIDASYEDGSTVYVSDVITFDGSDSYDPDGTSLTYDWEISNQDETFQGTTVEDYEYPTTLGTQESTLTVTDESGASATETHTVEVTARDPQASFTYSPKNPGPDETTTFDASSSKHREPKGEIVEYRWDFSHLNANPDKTGESVETSFPKNSETYEVTLTVEDQWGQTDSVTKQVETDAYQSCHEFLRERPDAESGYYKLDPLETNETIEVYCNMDYDGGGWTVIDKDAFYDFSTQIGNTTDRGGDIVNWEVSGTDVYSYDGGGDHYFIYWIDTGFQFTEIRTNEMTFGSSSYRANDSDTSEVRGDNTATGDWSDLNSGGVSGDIAIGTKDFVLTAWSEHRNTSWDSSWQWNGAAGTQLSHPDPDLQRFHFRNNTYGRTASSVGVGWGESGGQSEGWEWEKGKFMVRKPIDPPTYFYKDGTNNYNFQEDTSRESGLGSVEFQDTEIKMSTQDKGSERYIVSDSVDLSNYDRISVSYLLEVENGGSGYVEMEVGGRTVRDTIDDQYGVNDNTMSITTSDLTGTSPISIKVHTGADFTTTTAKIDQVWGREKISTRTSYSTDFDNGTDGWSTPSSSTLTTSNGWLRPQCSTNGPTQVLQKDLSTGISASQVSYDIQLAAVDSWDSEYLRFQIKDDDGWHTVESTSNTEYWVDDHEPYDCVSTDDWGEKEFNWTGTFDVNGSVQGVRVKGGIDQANNDESIAIDYVSIWES